MLKGILEGCILEIISREEIYGYEITKRLNNLGFSGVVDGTVYTILLRFQKNNLVNVRKISSKVGPHRKVFSLNDNGKRELKEFWNKWDFIKDKITKLREES